MTHAIRVTVLGPERTVETNYGPRQERDTEATLDYAVTEDRAWAIFLSAVTAATHEARITDG